MHRKIQIQMKVSEICFDSFRCICITEQACKDFLLGVLTCLVMSHPVFLQKFTKDLQSTEQIQLIYWWMYRLIVQRTSVSQHHTLNSPPRILACYVLIIFYILCKSICRYWKSMFPEIVQRNLSGKWPLESFAKGRRHGEMQSWKKYSR